MAHFFTPLELNLLPGQRPEKTQLAQKPSARPVAQKLPRGWQGCSPEFDYAERILSLLRGSCWTFMFCSEGDGISHNQSQFLHACWLSSTFCGDPHPCTDIFHIFHIFLLLKVEFAVIIVISSSLHSPTAYVASRIFFPPGRSQKISSRRVAPRRRPKKMGCQQEDETGIVFSEWINWLV